MNETGIMVDGDRWKVEGCIEKMMDRLDKKHWLEMNETINGWGNAYCSKIGFKFIETMNKHHNVFCKSMKKWIAGWIEDRM